MARCFMAGGGGGGGGDENLTATKEDVLFGKTYYGQDAQDDPGVGQMTNHAGEFMHVNTEGVGIDDTKTRVRVMVPDRALYDTTSGLDIDYGSFGDATAKDVITGKTFTSAAGLRIKGAIDEKGKGNIHVNDNVVTIDAGYYPSGGSATVGTLKEGNTFTASTNDQQVDAGTYCKGAQVFKAVSLEVDPNNLKKNTIAIIKSNNAEVQRVTGTMPQIDGGTVTLNASNTSYTINGGNYLTGDLTVNVSTYVWG